MTSPKNRRFNGNILVCDRNKYLLELYSIYLSDFFEIQVVDNVFTALKYIHSSTSIDLLITSYLFAPARSYLNSEISFSDGLDIALAFRAKFPDSPMIMATFGWPEYWPRVRQFQNLGNCWLLEKQNFLLPSMVEIVESIISKHRKTLLQTKSGIDHAS